MTSVGDRTVGDRKASMVAGNDEIHAEIVVISTRFHDGPIVAPRTQRRRDPTLVKSIPLCWCWIHKLPGWCSSNQIADDCAPEAFMPRLTCNRAPSFWEALDDLLRGVVKGCDGPVAVCYLRRE